MVAPSPPYLTVEQVLALPDDGNRYELVYGELLVSPSPRMRHQTVIGRLFVRMDEYCRRQHLGRVFTSPADVTWGRRDVLVQPDIFVVGSDDHAGEWGDVRSVTLAIEVTSPSTRQQDRFRKRLLYRDRGVETYWIVDPEGGFVEVWTPDADLPTVLHESVTWQPTGAQSALVVDIAELLGE